MEVKELQKHIRTLATLEVTGEPVVTCYADVSSNNYRHALDQRVREVEKLLTEAEKQSFGQSVEMVTDYLRGRLEEGTRGVALFARAGDEPFFQALQFRVSLPMWLSVDSTPNIYHLVEMKDTYDRYVLLITSEDKARIVEVNLGATTRELWLERPELRDRVGREWSKEHYQNHRRERTQQFVREKVKILERLISEGGYSHVILAGNPQMTARVKKELPKSLLEKLVDIVPASSRDRLTDVVDATLASFVEQEERESLELLDELLREIRTGGLAVAEPGEITAALGRGQVDVLILSASYSGADREEMVRLAEGSGCQVEVVNSSDALERLGGAGALLRYRNY